MLQLDEMKFRWGNAHCSKPSRDMTSFKFQIADLLTNGDLLLVANQICALDARE